MIIRCMYFGLFVNPSYTTHSVFFIPIRSTMQIRTRIKQLFSNKNYQGRINPVGLIVIFIIASLIWALPWNDNISQTHIWESVHAMTCNAILTLEGVTNEVNGDDGSISVTLPASAINEIYYLTTSSWTPLANNTNGFFSGLSDWDYLVYATYSVDTGWGTALNCGQTNTVSATIQAANNWATCNAILTLEGVTNEVNGDDGSISVTLPASAINEIYYLTTSSWTPLANNTNGFFSGLSDWNYLVYATYSVDTGWGTALNCGQTNTVSATIQETSTSSPTCWAITLDQITNDSSGSWASGNGFISVVLGGTSVSPPTSSISYTISGWTLTNPSSNSSGNFPGLDAWTYNIVASYNTASGSCTTNSISQTIQDTYTTPSCDSNSVASISSTNETSCNANNWTVTASYAWSGSPNSYDLIMGSTVVQSNSTWYFSNLVPGTYRVDINYTSSTSASCNVVSNYITVSAATCSSCGSSTASISSTNETSCNANNWTVSGTYNWDGTPISYELLLGNSVIDSITTNSNSVQFTGVSPGTYRVNINYTSSSSATCSVDSTNITVSAATCASCDSNANLDIDINNHETTCNSNNGSFTASLQNQYNSPVTYTLLQWNTTLSTNTSWDFSDLSPWTYYVSASYQWVNQTCTEISTMVTINAATCWTICDNASYTISKNNEQLCNANDWMISMDINLSQDPTMYNLIENWLVVSTSLNWNFSSLNPWTYRVQAVYSNCNVVTDAIAIHAAQCTWWWCDTNATVTANISNETTCNADNWSLQWSFTGTWTPSQYTLIQWNSIISANNTWVFTPLQPGNYRIEVTYIMPDTTICQETSSTLNISSATCSVAGCWAASSNEYSFANDIIQSDQCTTWVAWNVWRNLDDWEWQCVWNSTVTCQADIRDRDWDWVLDPDDQCIDVYWYEDEQWCPRTTTVRRRSWRWWSISPWVCGNWTRERNEACDDWNHTDFDWCNAVCEVEKQYDEHKPIANPTEMIVQKIKNSIISIQAACEYDDVDYNSKLNRFTDISWEDRYDPSYILTLFCITKWYKDKFQRTQPTWIWESIKMVTKVHAIWTNMSFNERGLTPWVMPYTDMTWSKWYAPYVSYWHNRGILQWITDSHVNPRALKALTPISPAQLDMLISNAWWSLTPLAQPTVDTDDLFDFLSFITPAPAHWSANGKYVTRQQAAEIVVSAFPDRFKNYKYLVWNNLQFYQILIWKIQNKSWPDQVAFVRKTIQDLEWANRELMWQELEIDVRVILDFLKEIVGDL